MDKQYQLNLTEHQLKKVIELAKKGTMSSYDRDLVEYLEWKLNNDGIQINTIDYTSTYNLDEIPF